MVAIGVVVGAVVVLLCACYCLAPMIMGKPGMFFSDWGFIPWIAMKWAVVNIREQNIWPRVICEYCELSRDASLLYLMVRASEHNLQFFSAVEGGPEEAEEEVVPSEVEKAKEKVAARLRGEEEEEEGAGSEEEEEGKYLSFRLRSRSQCLGSYQNVFLNWRARPMIDSIFSLHQSLPCTIYFPACYELWLNLYQSSIVSRRLFAHFKMDI